MNNIFLSTVIIILLVSILSILLIVLIHIVNKKNTSISAQDLDNLKKEFNENLTQLRQEVGGNIQTSVKTFGDVLSQNQKNAAEQQNQRISEMTNMTSERIKSFTDILSQNQKTSSENQNQQIADMTKTTSEKLNLFTNMLSESQKSSSEKQNQQIEELSKALADKMKSFTDMLSENQKNSSENQNKQIAELSKALADKIKSFTDILSENQKASTEQQSQKLADMTRITEDRLKSFEITNQQKIKDLQDTVENRLKDIQGSNEKKLSDIQNTVDEKLQKTLNERITNSFKLVSERLEEVYKGLGEMKTIASDVSGLKNVLSNVKNRGTLGEIQLENILEEILIPGQYEKQFKINKNSDDKVDFAIKLPGQNDDDNVYLPIDSKFPGNTYSDLQSAYDLGDKTAIDEAWKALERTLKNEAKSIKEKYINVPSTTTFAIMFLPFEGLYAEVARRGLIEQLQMTYSVSIAGPSTMAAMLNSLQMGFKTLQIQRKGAEVWKVLGAVKTEFDKFEETFTKAQNQIQQVEKSLDTLVGTRTKAIQKTLANVQLLDSDATNDVLKVEDKKGSSEKDKLELN